VVEPVLAAVRPKVIVEIGVRHGDTTVNLLELASRTGGRVHGIDPLPGDRLDLEGLQRRHGDQLVFHRKASLDALDHIGEMDAVIVDGDHNWYTVFNELKLIERCAARDNRPFPTVLLHDVDWPNGRRDRYANIDAIPEEYRHPSNFWTEESDSRIPRVGVRTAIEDFLEASDLPLTFISVVGFGGVGIIVPRSLVDDNDDLRRTLERFDSAEWLRDTCSRLDRVRRWAARNVGELQRRVTVLEAELAEIRARNPGSQRETSR
jgi:hypothetical protein